MSELKVKGKITSILDVETGTSSSGKEWAKVVFAITTEGEYPKEVAFTVFGEKKVENFLKFNKVNDTVEVSFNASSRFFGGRFDTELDAWRVWGDKGNEAPEVPVLVDEDDSDLPF